MLNIAFINSGDMHAGIPFNITMMTRIDNAEKIPKGEKSKGAGAWCGSIYHVMSCPPSTHTPTRW
jgi:hypothetical protein